MFVLLTCLLGGLSLSIIGSLTFWKIDAGWKFFIPIVLFVAGYIAVNIIYVLIIVISVLFIKKDKVYDRQKKLTKFLAIHCFGYIDVSSGIKANVTGIEKIPTNDKFLLVCNHRGAYDALILTHKLGKYDLAFITKPYNLKIPFVGPHLRALGYISIERKDALQSLDVVKTSIFRLENNLTSVVVFPEGTRCRDGSLGMFHEGMFNIAIKAKAPVVVASLSGTEKVKKNFPFKRTNVKLDVIETLQPSDIEFKTAKQVSDETYEIMNNHLKLIEGRK